MTDIVERLREESEHDPDSHESILFREAADEIEQLRQRLHEVSVDWQCSQAREAKLREALVALDEYYSTPGEDDWVRFLNEVLTPAREALALPTDDSALKEAIKEAKKEALLGAVERFELADIRARWSEPSPEKQLRKMVGELK
jgi:hypothetical protein